MRTARAIAALALAIPAIAQAAVTTSAVPEPQTFAATPVAEPAPIDPFSTAATFRSNALVDPAGPAAPNAEPLNDPTRAASVSIDGAPEVPTPTVPRDTQNQFNPPSPLAIADIAAFESAAFEPSTAVSSGPVIPAPAASAAMLLFSIFGLRRR